MERNDDTGLPAEAGQAADTGQDADTGQTGNTGQSRRKRKASNTGQSVVATEDEILETVLDSIIAQIKPTDTPEQIAKDVILNTKTIISQMNTPYGGCPEYRAPKRLLPFQIAKLMLVKYEIRLILGAGTSTNTDNAILSIYMADGPNAGMYVGDENEIYSGALRFNTQLTKREFGEIISRLRTTAKRVTRTMDQDLIAVNNGIFDYKAKKLLPFSPDYVFLTKSRVDYNSNAANVTIHNDEDGTDWDVESWIESLSDDTEIVDLIWKIIGAIVRPYVSWNKSAWLFSEQGNNGKGTLCELMRGLCGEEAAVTIPLKVLSKQFAKELLIRAVAIITDENPVGTFVDEADDLKAIITHDPVYVDRKNKSPITFKFYGFMVQCLNEFPRLKDKSDSFARRQLFIPFTKCFTGQERKYIKNDYLKRKEVLEYVLYRVLNMTYYDLPNPLACQKVLHDFREFNDPVRQFFQEMEFSFAWSILPLGFVYDVYKGWFRENNPSGSIQGRNTFYRELANVTKISQIWDFIGTDTTTRPGKKMDDPEPLIVQYDLNNWKNPHYTGSNPDLIAKTNVKDSYHGVLLRNDDVYRRLSQQRDAPNPTENS